MLLEAVARLEDSRVGQRVVDRRDPAIAAVVEAAVGPDRPVDAVHHRGVAPGEPPKPHEVEVERVEEACGRLRREAVALDLDPTLAELADERTKELMPSTRRWWRELVEERKIRPSTARPKPVHVDTGSRGELPTGTASRAGQAAKLHARCLAGN